MILLNSERVLCFPQKFTKLIFHVFHIKEKKTNLNVFLYLMYRS
jgi:hypothetical protein